MACVLQRSRQCRIKSASALSALNIDEVRFVLPLDAFPKQLDEIVLFSSHAARQRTGK